MIKVSIIVPIYNSEMHLEECISSIVNQTYRNIEIILVDDGSTDQSGAICDSFSRKDNRISVYHLENSGVAHARNIGIKHSSGCLIAFSDSDDILEEHYIEKAVGLIRHSEYVVGAFEKFNSMNQREFVDNMSSYGDVVRCTDFLEKMFAHQAGAYWGANWGKLYISEIIKNNHILFENGVGFAEDFRFNLEYLKYVHTVALIHDPVYYYRVDTLESLSKKRKDIGVYWNEYFELYNRLFKLAEVHGVVEFVKADLFRFLIEAYVAVLKHGIYHENLKWLEASVMCRSLDSNPEVQKAAGCYPKMEGRSRLYAYFISHNNGKVIALLLIIVNKLRNKQ